VCIKLVALRIIIGTQEVTLSFRKAGDPDLGLREVMRCWTENLRRWCL